MIKRLFVLGGGESPQVYDDFGNPQTVELSHQKGFLSIPDVGDEVVVIQPYGNNLDRAVIGVIEQIWYDLKPGDRAIVTDNCIIKLEKSGAITISGTKSVNINVDTGSEITIGGAGQTINLNGTIKKNGVPI